MSWNELSPTWRNLKRIFCSPDDVAAKERIKLTQRITLPLTNLRSGSRYLILIENPLHI